MENQNILCNEALVANDTRIKQLEENEQVLKLSLENKKIDTSNEIELLEKQKQILQQKEVEANNQIKELIDDIEVSRDEFILLKI